jgi:hypothetical protein
MISQNLTSELELIKELNGNKQTELILNLQSELEIKVN